jgi:hypothetical protein
MTPDKGFPSPPDRSSAQGHLRMLSSPTSVAKSREEREGKAAQCHHTHFQNASRCPNAAVRADQWDYPVSQLL